MAYVPYDVTEEILTKIDIDKILSILSEQDRTIILWWLRDGHTLPEILVKLRKRYGASKSLKWGALRKKVKLIINTLRMKVGKKDLELGERIKNNRITKVKIPKRTKKKRKPIRKSDRK